jgi:hypothetical protein
MKLPTQINNGLLYRNFTLSTHVSKTKGQFSRQYFQEKFPPHLRSKIFDFGMGALAATGACIEMSEGYRQYQSVGNKEIPRCVWALALFARSCLGALTSPIYVPMYILEKIDERKCRISNIS